MTTTHRRYRTLCHGLLLGAALLVWSCGGSSKKGADEPDDTGEAPAERARDSEGDVLIPPEKLDAIQRFFDRKRNQVTRCFVEAIEAGEVDKRASGRVTVMMTIDRKGRPTKVRVSQMQPRSAYLEKCVVENVEKWTVTDLPKPLDYSYTFGFDTL